MKAGSHRGDSSVLTPHISTLDLDSPPHLSSPPLHPQPHPGVRGASGLELVKENQVSADNIYYNRDYLCVVEKAAA